MLDGGLENDSLFGGTGNDIFLGGGDRSTMEGESGDDQMYGGSSNDVMFGGSGNDFMVGGLSQDTMYGGSGNDIIVGVDIGGTSGTDDTLYGGSGGDFFYLGNDNTNFYAGPGEAHIMDFSEADGDRVMLNGSASDYMFTDIGSDIYIQQSSDTAIIAILRDVATAAEVQDSVIYIG
jgi:Ca2+-binding RTX toxin-like protein